MGYGTKATGESLKDCQGQTLKSRSYKNRTVGTEQNWAYEIKRKNKQNQLYTTIQIYIQHTYIFLLP